MAQSNWAMGKSMENPNSFMIFPIKQNKVSNYNVQFPECKSPCRQFSICCLSILYFPRPYQVTFLKISSSSQRLHWLQCRRGNDSPCCTSTGLPSNLGRPREAIKTKPTKTVILRTYNDLYCVSQFLWTSHFIEYLP